MKPIQIVKRSLVITAITIACGCAPQEFQMTDSKAYMELSSTYDSIGSFKNEEQFVDLDRRFTDFENQYQWSSYLDNGYYYHGRLFQEWGDEYKNSAGDSLKADKHRTAMSNFEKIENGFGYYDESLYRIAQSMDTLLRMGNQGYDTASVIKAYKRAEAVAPNSTYGLKATKRIGELQ